MAHVAQPPAVQSNVDYHLDYQFQAWESIPEYIEWWPGMDASQKEAFHLEWVGITESRLGDLQRWADLRVLTTAQYARYEELLKLIARHRPLVERLLQN